MAPGTRQVPQRTRGEVWKPWGPACSGGSLCCPSFPGPLVQASSRGSLRDRVSPGPGLPPLGARAGPRLQCSCDRIGGPPGPALDPVPGRSRPRPSAWVFFVAHRFGGVCVRWGTMWASEGPLTTNCSPEQCRLWVCTQPGCTGPGCASGGPPNHRLQPPWGHAARIGLRLETHLGAGASGAEDGGTGRTAAPSAAPRDSCCRRAPSCQGTKWPPWPPTPCSPRLLPLQLLETKVTRRPGSLRPYQLPVPATLSGEEAQGGRLRAGGQMESRSQ